MMIKIDKEKKTVSLMDLSFEDIHMLLAALDFAADKVRIKTAIDLRNKINVVLNECKRKML